MDKKLEPIIFGKSKIRTSKKGDLCLVDVIDIIDVSKNKTNKKEMQKFCNKKTYEEDGNIYITPNTVLNLLNEYNNIKAKELLKHLEKENIIEIENKSCISSDIDSDSNSADNFDFNSNSSNYDSEPDNNEKTKKKQKYIKIKTKAKNEQNIQSKNEQIIVHNYSHIFEYSNKKFDYIIKNINGENVPFFKGMDVAEFFEYADTNQAIRKHVDEDEKFKLIDLLGPVESTGLTYDEKNTFYISEPGIYSLVWQSKKPQALAFKKFVKTELLPTLRKTGSYSIRGMPQKTNSFINRLIKDTSQIENFYNKNNIITFFQANVFYLIVVGMFDGCYVIKFGHSMRIFERDYNEHKKTFGEQSKVIFVAETDNNILVETQFKKFLETKNALFEMEFGGKNRVELFKTSQNLSIEDTIEAAEMLIEKNPSNAEKKVKEYEQNKNKYQLALTTKLEIAKEKTKQEEEKTKQIQIQEEEKTK
jgi:prophage antirepressor-like protein